jgi:hypothetical protein
MSLANISKSMEIVGGAARGRRGWRACVALGCVLVTAAVVAVASTPGIAEAASAPSAQLSFSPATISTGSQPDMTFISQNVPSGSLLYLQESSDGGHQWKTVDKTTDTQGTANIAALSEGVYEFRIVITDDGTALAASAPAALTVTGPGGAMPAPPPAPTAAPTQPTATAPSPAPSRSGIPWLHIIVKPIWDAIIAAIVTWIISLF